MICYRPFFISRILHRRHFSSKRKEVERYLERQASDQYSQRARAHSYRARSAFKLLQINEKMKFIRPGLVAIDVGAAPGSWCQVLSELMFPGEWDSVVRTDGAKKAREQRDGYILGVDLLSIAPIENVELLCRADITREATQTEIRRRLEDRKVDLLISDMAPNPIGLSLTDHLRIIELCEQLVKFATSEDDEFGPILAHGGIFLCKIFDGPNRKEFITRLSSMFKNVQTVKPDASRDASSEIYVYASEFTGGTRERR